MIQILLNIKNNTFNFEIVVFGNFQSDVFDYFFVILLLYVHILTETSVSLWVRRPLAHDAGLAEEGRKSLQLVLSWRHFGVVDGRQDPHFTQL